MLPDYFLLYCEEDKSFSVVPAEDVIFRGFPKVNDVVKFFYNANNQEYEGKIINMAGGTDSYKKLVEEQKKLNTTKGREEPFDPTKRRHAFIKQREQMQQIVKGNRRQSTEAEPKTKVPKRAPKNKVIIDDTSDDDDISSIAEGELPEKENSRQNDMSTLKKAAQLQNKRPQTAAQRSRTEEHREELSSPNAERSSSNAGASTPSYAESNQDIEDESPDNGKQSQKSELRLKCSRKRRARTVKVGVNVEEKNFTGEMVKYKEANKELKIVELFDKSNVFLLKSDLMDLRRTCNTTTKVARALMDAIFTDEALLECSLSGEVYTGSGAGNYTKRTPLEKHVIAAIKEYTMRFSEKRGFPYHDDDVRMSAAMRSKLSEMRYAYRRNQEDEAGIAAAARAAAQAAAEAAALAAAEAAALAAAEAAAQAAADAASGQGQVDEDALRTIRESARKAATDALASRR